MTDVARTSKDVYDDLQIVHFLGYLSAVLPELHHIESPRLLQVWDEYKGKLQQDETPASAREADSVEDVIEAVNTIAQMTPGEHVEFKITSLMALVAEIERQRRERSSETPAVDMGNPISEQNQPFETQFPHLDTCRLKYGGSKCTCGLDDPL